MWRANPQFGSIFTPFSSDTGRSNTFQPSRTKLPGAPLVSTSPASTSRATKLFIFTDESIIRAIPGKTAEWCPWTEKPSELPLAKYTAQVHVWGAVGPDFCVLANVNGQELTGARGGMNAKDFVAMLEKAFLPKFRHLKKRYPTRQFVLVQDGASIHNANLTIEALKSWGVEVMAGWPPHSPDLNPIENAWGLTKREANSEIMEQTDRTKQNQLRMFRVVKKHFIAVFKQHKNELVDPDKWKSRLKQVIDVKGALLKY